MKRRHLSALLAAPALLAAAGRTVAAVPAAASSADSAEASAQVLFDDYWQWLLDEFPEQATFFGERRHADRLRDESLAAWARRRAALQGFRARLDRLPTDRLPQRTLESAQALRFTLDGLAALDAFGDGLPVDPWGSWAPVNSLGGPQFELAELARAARFFEVADYEAWLARLEAFPRQVDELIDRLEAARMAGWMPSRVAVSAVPGQFEQLLARRVADHPAYEPFREFPAAIGPERRERLAAAGRQAIERRVQPAYARLKDYLDRRYLPSAREALSVSTLPGGPALYDALLHWHTTTRLSAREVHEIGLAEVDRIERQMAEVMARTGFVGSAEAFATHLATDPRFYFSRAEDLIAGYRDIAKRADAALPKLFATLPRMPYGVRAKRPEEGEAADSYTPGAADGSRPGWFEANANHLASRPKWAMETLLLHEAVPGHHLQSALAMESAELPHFRRDGWFTAMGEGWALYAESLGEELGFYADPYQKFGNLSYEMLRASRLVVDTGLHAFGWSRERAIDYHARRTRLPREEVVPEIDRYIGWPGQATAYKIGERRIRALREEAARALGERFDVRRFHDLLLAGGTLPLEVLAARVQRWVAGERRRTTG